MRYSFSYGRSGLFVAIMGNGVKKALCTWSAHIFLVPSEELGGIRVYLRM